MLVFLALPQTKPSESGSPELFFFKLMMPKYWWYFQFPLDKQLELLTIFIYYCICLWCFCVVWPCVYLYKNSGRFCGKQSPADWFCVYSGTVSSLVTFLFSLWVYSVRLVPAFLHVLFWECWVCADVNTTRGGENNSTCVAHLELAVACCVSHFVLPMANPLPPPAARAVDQMVLL